MNAKLTAMIAALGAYAVTLSDFEFEIPDEIDAEIDELLTSADEFATGISDAESNAVLLAQLTEMLDAIKAELTAAGTTITIPSEEKESLVNACEFLGCLEACGVDNWDGYSDAREMLCEADE